MPDPIQTPKPAARTRGRTPAQLVRQSNTWRDPYNPLRGLAISRVVSLLEAGERGEFADLQWTYRLVEKRYAILRACVARRRAALVKLDWDIKIMSQIPAGQERLAEEQQLALREAYDGIENFREAIGELARAEFRGYTHLQKHRRPDGSVRELHWLPQWNWTRDGLWGPWVWNPDAASTTALSLPAEQRIGDGGMPREEFVIRTCEAPINEIGLVAYVYAMLGAKDWAGFVELFGLPGAVVTMPPDTPPGKEEEYESAASSVAESCSGTLPNGASVEFPASVIRTNGPFREWCEWQEKDVVLAATGGKLTMLTESGSGTLAGGAHQDTWDELAAAEAQDVSEVMQRDFDRHILAAAFPDQPILAYFELYALEDEDADNVTERIVKLAGAGYRTTREEVAEKVGLDLDEAPEPTAPTTPTPTASPMANRVGSIDSVEAALRQIRNGGDPDQMRAGLRALSSGFSKAARKPPESRERTGMASRIAKRPATRPAKR